MTTKQRQEMYQQVEQHGKNLLAIFPQAKIKDTIKLCKSLLRLENKAHKLATDYCNGLYDCESVEKPSIAILKKVTDLLGQTEGIKFNMDPRGYSLKLSDEYVRENNLSIYRDMGGYGILAPDFSYQYQN